MAEQTTEVMMSMPKGDALQHIEITVLRQIGENIQAQSRHLESLSVKVDDIKERVIRIEARDTEKRVDSMERRVYTLETQGNKTSGGIALMSWLTQSAPWIFAIVAGIAAWSKH